MERSAVQESVLSLDPGPRKRLRASITCALLVAILVSASGCASYDKWTFGTTRWVAGEDLSELPSGSSKPPLIVLVPFVIFDLIFFPIAIIHDQWPRSRSMHESADRDVQEAARK